MISVLSESWRVVHTDYYHYALVYVCRRSSSNSEYCAYETLLVLVRPEAMMLNSHELAEYFQLTIPKCLQTASRLDFVIDSGKWATTTATTALLHRRVG